MPIPRKNPRTVVSEEQKKLTEGTTAAAPTSLEAQSTMSANNINDTKEQSLKRNNGADSINDTKEQSLKRNNDADSINDTKEQNIQGAVSTINTNDTKEQSNNDIITATRSVLPRADETEKPNAQNAIRTSPTKFKRSQNAQRDKDRMNTKSQNAISTKDTDTQSTEDREREVYYLTLSQVDKLDDLRIAYRKATGRRLNKQDFMRHIVDSLDLNMLV